MASSPPRLKATAGAPPREPEWVLRVLPAGWPVAVFHSRTVLSPPALASSAPSGLNATPSTPYRALAWKAATGRQVAVFHSRAVPSASALASSVPSRLNATARTPYRVLVLPLAWRGLPTGRQVAVFYSRTTPSPSALASSVPSGLNATP